MGEIEICFGWGDKSYSWVRGLIVGTQGVKDTMHTHTHTHTHTHIFKG